MQDESLIIEDMKLLGFSEYETKAYFSLLKEYPVTGYILSKNSGIPRSRIYEVLNHLKSKQLVFEDNQGKNVLYLPLEPHLLVEKLKNQFNNILNKVDNYTKKVYQEDRSMNKLIIIKGRDKIIDFVKLLISNSEKRISLSIWEEEIDEISTSLDNAIKRGVIVKGIYFGKNNKFRELVTHRRIDRYLSKKKERYMTVTVDRTYVISGIISRGEESQVTWVKDAGFVEMSEDYIVHDLMVNLYSQKLNDACRIDYENFLDNVRKDYYFFTEEEFNKFK